MEKLPSYFKADVRVERDGRIYELTLGEQQALVSRGNYWHREGDPSSWLSVATFEAVRRKYEQMGDSLGLDLAALALGIGRQRLIDVIRWHENYMRWHDGDDAYQVLDPQIVA